ncbi:GNAT family N-acetyltransferase [Planococcus sp. 1R117A]|uniref:GNAT family N-acetyltransferase n=1 Tax=Planococcus sp. 1R117A TaxID=3447020 RepID=UPI003EDBE327
MNIRQLEKDEDLPIELLLEADPSEKLVREYVSKGISFIAEKDFRLIGIYVLLPISNTKVEIKNIAVAVSERGKGCGKKLVLHALKEAERLGFEVVEIGTGNSSFDQLALYQKCGFRMTSIDRGFFTRHYLEPIVENGILCQDMVRLEYKIR